MKTLKQHIVEFEQSPSDIYNNIISKMISKPGYQGHEIIGDEVSFSFDNDGNASIAYDSIDADEYSGCDCNNTDGDCDCDDIESVDESLNEAKMIIKVNSKGQKHRRLKCPKGKKLNQKGTTCVPITGRAKAVKKIAIRKGVKTKKAKGSGAKNKANRKRMKAMRKRSAMGL